MKRNVLSLALHNIVNAEGHQLVTGAIVGPDFPELTPLVAWATPVAPIPAPKGRKKNLARLAAILLAHAWYRARGLSIKRADQAVAVLLHYADCASIQRARRRRNEIKGRYLLVFAPNSNGRNEDSGVLLFEQTATLEIAPDRMRFEGPGWKWNYGEREAQYHTHWKSEGNMESPLSEAQIAAYRSYWEGGARMAI